MAHKLRRTIAGLWESIFPTDWRLYERSTKSKNVTVRSPAKQRRTPREGIRKTGGSTLDSNGVSKRKRGQTYGHRPTSAAFVRLLRDAAESDHNFRVLSAKLAKERDLYRQLMMFRSEDLGSLQRLKETGIQDEERETHIAKRDYAENHAKFRADFASTTLALPGAVKERKRAFKAMYRTAQEEIHRVPVDKDAQLHLIIPQKFFNNLQRALDAHRITLQDEERLKEARKQLLSVHVEIKTRATHESGADEEVRERRREALKRFQAARAEVQLNIENLAIRENNLLKIVQPILAERGFFEGAAISTVSRGSDHKPFRKDRVDARTRETPRTRVDLTRQRNLAVTMLDMADRRYERLASRYHEDLERFLAGDPAGSKSDFDQCFFKDRNIAVHDVSVADYFRESIRNIQYSERLINLEHMSSAFGSISGDGYEGSLNADASRDLGRQTRLNRPRILEFINMTDNENFVDPFEAKSEPSYEHDLPWDGKPIAPDDFETQTIQELTIQGFYPNKIRAFRRWRGD